MRHMSANLFSSVFVPRSTFYDSPFGRIFNHLAPWVPEGATDQERAANLGVFARDEMFEPTGAGSEFDNANLPAGYTYLGQFIDHDITFDPTSSLMRANDPNRLRNFRTPRLDLDSVYGKGPNASPYLYDADRSSPSGDGFTGFFLIGKGASGQEDDLPRNSRGTALIGEPRNDENIIVSQIQLSILKLHNRVLDNIVGDPNQGATQEQFQEAQRIVRWFYQYIVWNDFVKRIVADTVFNEVLQKEAGVYVLKNRFYDWKQAPYIPVEFSVAAYRFGHSLVRPGYQINIRLGVGVEKPIFDPLNPGAEDDLHGGRPLPENHTLQWDWFLQFPSSGGPFPQNTRQIDTKLSSSVFRIPTDGFGGNNPLAFLNLVRGWRMELPAGPAVAKAMGVRPLDVAGNQQALWYYILKEAETLPDGKAGQMLGPVGGRIVTEVFAGLLKGDPLSYVNCDPNWTPAQEPHLPFNVPDDNRDDWEFADLIKAAGMPIDGNDINQLLGTP